MGLLLGLPDELMVTPSHIVFFVLEINIIATACLELEIRVVT